MPQILRRTPASEEAMQYGYRDFLQDIVRKTVEDTAAGFRKPLDFSDEVLLEMGLAGIGGVAKFTKGLAPVFRCTEEALAFGRTAPRGMATVLREAMTKQEGLTKTASRRYSKTGSSADFKKAMEFGTQRQLYREALEEMGEM